MKLRDLKALLEQFNESQQDLEVRYWNNDELHDIDDAEDVSDDLSKEIWLVSW